MLELFQNPAFLALFGTVFGASGLKIVEYWLNKSRTEEDIAASIRKELRDDISGLRAAVQSAEKDADVWRERYWEMVEQAAKCNARSDLMNHKLDGTMTVVEEHHPGELTKLKELPS